MGSITFIGPDGEEQELEAQPGISVMQIATSSAVDGIDAECGGSLSCATCHVYVHEDWFADVGVRRRTWCDVKIKLPDQVHRRPRWLGRYYS